MEMLKYINTQHKKVKKEFITANGKKMFKMQKRTIYIYAHNSANFDTYFYLNTIGIRCNKMIEKGGIMSLEVDSEEFHNVKFIMRDSYKFLAKKLKKLCESFKIPEEYRKSEMDHDAVNEANWQELKPVWEPYLKLDVISLALIWIKFIQMMRNISPMIDVR